VPGSAAYVAIEQVKGTLHGYAGTFVLQHTGTMNRGAAQLTVTVVPDSGAEKLVGLKGTMTIDIIDGKHWYEFEYSLAEEQ
jgi:predicted glycosyltransferase